MDHFLEDQESEILSWLRTTYPSWDWTSEEGWKYVGLSGPYEILMHYGGEDADTMQPEGWWSEFVERAHDSMAHGRHTEYVETCADPKVALRNLVPYIRHGLENGLLSKSEVLEELCREAT